MSEPNRAPKTIFNLVKASTVQPKKTYWLVENMIPWNGLTLLGGREGVGKSTVACAWVAGATRGNLDNKQPLNVLYLHTEDSREATIVPRLKAADADLERVYFLDIELQYDGEDPIESGLVLPAHFPRLRQVIEDNNIGMIVLDAAKSAMASSIDGNRDESVRRMLDPMNKIADELGCVFLALVHFGKRESVDTGKLITGSIAWSQVARSVIAVAKDEDGKLLVATTKHNLAPHAVTLDAHIESADVFIEGKGVPVGKAVFDGASNRSINDLLAPADDEIDSRSEIEMVVLDYLEAEGGSAPARDVLKAARDAGLKEEAVKKARRGMGITTKRRGFGKGSMWVWAIDSPIDSIDSNTREREPMAPMTAPMAKAGNQLNEICSVICDSLSPEIGLTEHTLRGSIPSSLQPQQHLSAALSHLEQQGAIIKDAKGRYLLSQEPPNSRKQEERTRQ
ncbi:AAA family ATPase [Corynebacterium amycolatum]|uniref:AAA family ATPase n=1 Tax=Corynebacterium amycolatum TaxID=43765 RepID=UPI00211A3C0D|nr:AAA family ATPase [Corynebacterium amycolatum]